jgi:hypothetical protein
MRRIRRLMLTCVNISLLTGLRIIIFFGFYNFIHMIIEIMNIFEYFLVA